jgi:hypothetical protein
MPTLRCRRQSSDACFQGVSCKGRRMQAKRTRRRADISACRAPHDLARVHVRCTSISGARLRLSGARPSSLVCLPPELSADTHSTHPRGSPRPTHAFLHIVIGRGLAFPCVVVHRHACSSLQVTVKQGGIDVKSTEPECLEATRVCMLLDLAIASFVLAKAGPNRQALTARGRRSVPLWGVIAVAHSALRRVSRITMFIPYCLSLLP